MITISVCGEEQPIQLAAHELCDTLCAMGLSACLAEQGGIRLCLFEALGLVPVGKNPSLDDEIAIAVAHEQGYIAGANPRSVLIAAYRFLSECGARYVRPGKDGTYLPQITALPDVSLRELADMRYRAICLEGAVSQEHVMNMIEWMPKHGFNAYFIQFRDGFTFYDRWYSHIGSTVKPPQPISRETAMAYTMAARRAIKMRGMQFHAVGHGWACEPFGVRNDGWDPVEESTLPKEYLSICAQLNGRRGLWEKMPLCTQLCYSRPDVRRKMVDAAVSYIRENPDVDYLCYDLSDGYRNSCECEECRRLPLSDYYWMILNELDERLTAEGLDTKIVWEIYSDLLYPPMKTRLKNPGRFVLMFCPTGRAYSRHLPDGFPVTEIPPYQVNGVYDTCMEDSLAYLYHNKKLFDGDIFCFDYHLMYNHFMDATKENLARVIYEDIQRYDAFPFSGLMSCQLQRMALPTALPMVVMGKTLWKRSTPYEDIRRELYAAAFGEADLGAVTDYLVALSDCINVGVLKDDRRPADEVIALMERAIRLIEDFRPTIERHLSEGDPCRASSWRQLLPHGEIYTMIARSCIAELTEGREAAAAWRKQAAQYVWEHEDELQDVVDGHFFDDIISTRCRIDLGDGSGVDGLVPV